MNKTILSVIAVAGFCTLMLSACQGRVTVQGENGQTDTIEFNTDTIRNVNISIQVGQPASETLSATEADSL